jgi:sulfate permease, SulP family
MLKRFVPILDWLPQYTREQLQGDLSAGLTVGVMLIPQGMAYAMIAGLDPIHGLYAVTVPLILYAILGTSRQLAVGPVAMISLLTAAGIGALNPETPEMYLLYAFTAAFLVGVFQFAMGIFRLGFLVNLLSHPVISGFTSAAAIIIGLSQLKHLLRIDLPKSEHVQEMFLALAKNIGSTHLLTLGIGLVAILVIKYGKKIHKSLPTSLIAVIVGILTVWGLNLTELGIKIVGEVPSGLPGVSSPSFDPAVWKSLLSVALTISLVGFMESFAVAKAIQAKHKNYQVDANQELIALGVANLSAAFFQGYPITGGFSRTAVNDQAGAKTGMASVFSAILIVLTLLFLTPLFYFLPNAVLAAVVMVAVIGLIDYKEAIHLWKEDRSDFWMLIATFVVTLTMGIETGIGTGVVLSLAMVVYRSARPHIAILGKVPNSDFYRNIQRFENLEQRKDILILRLDGPLYFANLNYFKEQLMSLIAARGEALKAVVINADGISHVDSSAVHALKDWIKEIQNQGLELYFSNLIGPVRDIFAKSGLVELIGANNLFMGNQQAVDHFDNTAKVNHQPHLHKDYTLQNNA